jgi:tetratricopeptide (TPR) repeat protein
LDAHDVQREVPRLIELLQARSDIKQGQARQAIERLKTIDIRQVPAHLYWMVSGDAQSQIDHPEAAIQAYGLAVGAAPKSVAAYVKRAQLLQSLRDHKSAEDDYSRAISLEPAVATLYMRRAFIREERRDLVGAIQDMDAALALEPKSNRMLLVRARLHHLADHPAQHREDFRDALTITPKAVEDWISRALAQLPRYPERAKTDLQAALRIEPTSTIALQNLAYVESEHLHDMEAAMSALDQILLWNAENESALSGRSVLQARFGRVQECLQDLDILAKRESKLLPSTLYQMGCAHALISKQSNKSVERALYLLAKAIRRGYGAEVIETDPDLDLLRGHASFVALITVAQLYRDK